MFDSSLYGTTQVRKGRRLLIELLEDRTTPAFLNVTSNLDTDVPDAVLTLREAIAIVNAGDTTGRSAEEIAEVSGTLGESDTISLRMAYANATITMAGPRYHLAKSVDIVGPVEFGTRIDAQDSRQIFFVDGRTSGPINVSFQNLGLDRGNANGTGGSITGGVDNSLAGGAIFNDSGIVSLYGCYLGHNHATDGGAIYNLAGVVVVRDAQLDLNSADQGGAIFNNGGTLTVTNTLMWKNSALVLGAGVVNQAGSTTLTRSYFSEGTSSGHGGGAAVVDGLLTVRETRLSYNTAQGDGGGVYVSGGELRVEFSTLYQNQAFREGGGILAANGSVLIAHSTISENIAEFKGGALANKGAIVQALNATIANNRWNTIGVGAGAGIWTDDVPAAETRIRNTIVAKNPSNATPATGKDVEGKSLTADSSFNLILSNTAAGGLTDGDYGNKVGVDPLLGALRDDGATVRIHPLLTGSPALNAGSNANLDVSDTLDQRGLARITGAAVDMGAFEKTTLSGPFMVDSEFDILDGDYGPGGLSLREAVIMSNELDGPDTIRFQSALTTIRLQAEIFLTDPATTTIDGGLNGITVDSLGFHRAFSIVSASAEFVRLAVVNGIARGAGGGIMNAGTLVLKDSFLTGNHGSIGGGVLNGGTLTVINSTINNNRSSAKGGGIYNAGVLTIVNGTITGNRSDQSVSGAGLGGGIWTEDEANRSTTIKNTLVAGNMWGAIADEFNGKQLEPASTFNLVQDAATAGGLTNNVNGNIVGADPLLEFGTNFGPSTVFIGVATGSPAINAGSNGNLPIGLSMDQRGLPRIFGGSVDIGATEYLHFAGVVDSLADDVDGDLGEGQLTLREALLLADEIPIFGYVRFSSNLTSSGPATISLAAELRIHSSVDIQGPGENLLILDGNSTNRIVAVDDYGFSFQGDVKLSGMTLTNGRARFDGGAIFVNASVELTHVIVKNSFALGLGGGIVNSGQLKLSFVTIENNSGNSPALYNLNFADMTVENSSVINNTNGAIVNRGVLHVSNSTISGNTTNGLDTAAGIDTSSDDSNAFTVLRFVTIANNTNFDANGPGGLFTGRYGAGASIVGLTHSILSNPRNFGSSGATVGPGDFHSYGFNLSSDLSGADFLNYQGELNGVDPLLGPLADNGGPTKTHNLLVGSPAFNAGDPLLYPDDYSSTPDQRGWPFSRQVAGRVDIGAVEFSPLVSITATDPVANEDTGDVGVITLTRIDNLDSPTWVKFTYLHYYGASYEFLSGVGGTFDPGSHKFFFDAGASTGTIVFRAVNDRALDTGETLRFALEEWGIYSIDPNNASVTLVIEDQDASVSIAASATSTEEGGDTVVIQVRREGYLADALPVHIATELVGASLSDFTLVASSGGTFDASSGVFTYTAGAVSGTLELRPINDSIFEVAESVRLNLVDVGTYTLGSPQTVTVTILPNDPIVTLLTQDAVAHENATSPANEGAWKLTRSFLTGLPLQVSLVQTLGGASNTDFFITVLSGGVYDPGAGVFTFDYNAATAVIILTARNDALTEGDESVTLSIVANNAFQIGSSSSGTITIPANDPVVTLSATDNVAEEGDTSPANRGTWTLTRNGDTSRTLSVNVAFALQGASSSDFTVAAGSGGTFNPTTNVFTFNAGSATGTIILTALTDTLKESDERLTLSLLGGSATYFLGATASGVITIPKNGYYHVAVEPILGVNSLLIEDLNDVANNLTISLNFAKTHVVLTDLSTVLTTNIGSVSNNGHTVAVPLSAFANGRIQINTAGGNDTITFDLKNGALDPIGNGSIFLNAGDGTDSLKILGAGTGYVRFITGLLASAPTAGSLRFKPDGVPTIQNFLSNLEGVNITNVGTLDLLTRNGNDAVTFARLNATEGRITGTSGVVNNAPRPFLPVTYSATPTLYYYSSNGDVAGVTTNHVVISPNGLRTPGLKTFVYSGGPAFDSFEIQNAADLKLPVAGGQVLFNGGGTYDTFIVTGNTNFTLTASRLTPASGGFARFVNVERVALIGGAGNNTINATGFTGAAILDGQAGADTITGGSGRNILIGGLGADTITGGASDDILIGGTTTFAANSGAMAAVADEWLRTLAYIARITHLKAGGGFNDPTKFGTVTAPNDSSIDKLKGLGGNDWFWAFIPNDDLLDRLAAEFVR